MGTRRWERAEWPDGDQGVWSMGVKAAAKWEPGGMVSGSETEGRWGLERGRLLVPYLIYDLLDFSLINGDQLAAAIDDLALGFDFGDDLALDFYSRQGYYKIFNFN